MKRRVKGSSEVVLLKSILGPNTFLQSENVRDPEEYFSSNNYGNNQVFCTWRIYSSPSHHCAHT